MWLRGRTFSPGRSHLVSVVLVVAVAVAVVLAAVVVGEKDAPAFEVGAVARGYLRLERSVGWWYCCEVVVKKKLK